MSTKPEFFFEAPLASLFYQNIPQFFDVAVAPDDPELDGFFILLSGFFNYSL